MRLKFEKEWSNRQLEAGLRRPSKRADDAAFDYETELAGARLPAGDQRMQLLAIDRDSEPAAA